MKNLKSILFEKLVINKNIGNVQKNNLTFPNSENNKGTIENRNWILDADFPDGHFTFFKDYIKEILKTCVLTNSQKEFLEEFLDDIKDLKNKPLARAMQVMNGQKPHFQRAKCIYDICMWALKNPNITVPRKNKLNKILRENPIISNEELGWGY